MAEKERQAGRLLRPMRSVVLGPGEIVAKAREVAALRAKAEAHDDYHSAVLTMALHQRKALEERKQRSRATPLDQFWLGYCRCLRDFGQAVIDAQAERMNDGR